MPWSVPFEASVQSTATIEVGLAIQTEIVLQWNNVSPEGE